MKRGFYGLIRCYSLYLLLSVFRRRLWPSARSERSILLGACRSTQKKRIIADRKIFTLLCRSLFKCAKYYYILFQFFFLFPVQILEPKNLFCDSNVSQPYL